MSAGGVSARMSTLTGGRAAGILRRIAGRVCPPRGPTARPPPGAATISSQSSQGPLWAITTYFNPGRFETRRANYRAFRARSRAQGLPLVTVELATEQSAFELDPGEDAELLLQRRSPAVLWHKERLLNLGLEALPPSCEFVCWVDADVIFEDDDWISKAVAGLERHKVLQPFEFVLREPRAGRTTPFPRSRLGWLLNKSLPSNAYSSSFCSSYRPGRARVTGTTGYVWCARRAPLDAHGFYDRCIVGGGDREIAFAFSRPRAEIPDKDLRIRHGKLREHISAWSDRMHADVRGDLSYLRGAIRHLWHGDAKHRGYTERHEILRRHDFDPERDIELDDNGCWRWAPGTEELAAEVKRYFASRKEDG